MGRTNKHSTNPQNTVLHSPASKALQFSTTTMLSFKMASLTVNTAIRHPPAFSLAIRDFSEIGYYAQKAARKERRRRLYHEKLERIERRKTRRAGKNRRYFRDQFRAFWYPKRRAEAIMDQKARQKKMDWKINVATILERIPVVLPDLEPWEQEWDDLSTHLDQYGKLYPEEFYGGPIDFEANMKTNEELLAMLPFTPPPRETAADHSGEIMTIERKLKTNIYYIEKKERWQFPIVELKQPDETILQAGERAIVESVGKNLKYWSPSNCPWSIDMMQYDEEKQQETKLFGEKTFFLKIQHYKHEAENENFAWLDRQEIVDRVKEEQGEEKARFYHYLL